MIRSMSVRLALVTVLAAPLVAACGSDKPSPPAAAASAAPAPTAPAPAAARKALATPAVKPYQDDAYGFAVEAARAPTKGEQQVPTAIGTLTAHTYMFSSASAPGAMMVAVTPSFDKDGELDAKRALDDGQQGMLTNMSAKLVESAELELDGATGRMFRFTARPQGQRAAGYGKMYLRDGALYQILVVHLDSAKGFKEEGERFVDSFRFTPRVAGSAGSPPAAP